MSLLHRQGRRSRLLAQGPRLKYWLSHSVVSLLLLYTLYHAVASETSTLILSQLILTSLSSSELRENTAARMTKLSRSSLRTIFRFRRTASSEV